MEIKNSKSEKIKQGRNYDIIIIINCYYYKLSQYIIINNYKNYSTRNDKIIFVIKNSLFALM